MYYVDSSCTSRWSCGGANISEIFYHRQIEIAITDLTKIIDKMSSKTMSACDCDDDSTVRIKFYDNVYGIETGNINFLTNRQR